MLIRLKLAAVAGMLAAACTGSFDPDTPPAGGDGGVDEAAVRADFATNISPILALRCDSCHDLGVAGAPAFGKTYDSYVAYSSAAGKLVDCTTAKSTLYAKGAHLGPAFDATEAPKVEAFIALHAMIDATCDGGGGATARSASIALQGTNTVDLSTLGPGLDGAQLTFSAQSVAGGVYLSAMKLVAGTNGLKAKHPTFETCPGGTATADPTDKFAAVDVTVPAGQTVDLGAGSLTITGGDLQTTKLGVKFESITPEAGSQGAPVDNGGACAQ